MQNFYNPFLTITGPLSSRESSHLLSLIPTSSWISAKDDDSGCIPYLQHRRVPHVFPDSAWARDPAFWLLYGEIKLQLASLYGGVVNSLALLSPFTHLVELGLQYDAVIDLTLHHRQRNLKTATTRCIRCIFRLAAKKIGHSLLLYWCRDFAWFAFCLHSILRIAKMVSGVHPMQCFRESTL